MLKIRSRLCLVLYVQFNNIFSMWNAKWIIKHVNPDLGTATKFLQVLLKCQKWSKNNTFNLMLCYADTICTLRRIHTHLHYIWMQPDIAFGSTKLIIRKKYRDGSGKTKMNYSVLIQKKTTSYLLAPNRCITDDKLILQGKTFRFPNEILSKMLTQVKHFLHFFYNDTRQDQTVWKHFNHLIMSEC